MPKPVPVTASKIMQLIENQHFRCALSGRKLTPETASLDHIVPLSRGGSHEIENLWVVEHLVNTAKGTMTVDEFLEMCRDVTHMHSQSLDQAPILGTSEKSLF